MSSTSDKIKGYANEAAGTLKQGVGKAVGNDRLRAKGAAQKMTRRSGRAAPSRNAQPRNTKINPISRTKCWLNGPVVVTPGTEKYQSVGA